jgi:hypothetical protein
VPAVEGRSCMRGDIDREHRLPARRIEGIELLSGGIPDVLTVKRNPCTWSTPGKGPYSRRISAADPIMLLP